MNQRHYEITASELLHNEDFSIRRLGIREQMPTGIINRPTGNDTWLLMLFHSPVQLDSGSGPAECSSDTMLVWAPGSTHWYGNENRSWTHTWVHLSGSLVADRIVKAAFATNTPFHIPDPDSFVRFVADLLDEITRRPAPDSSLLVLLFDVWLRRHHLSTDPATVSRIPREFLAVKSWMETEFRSTIRLKDLAERVNLSIPRFCSLFKNYFGTSAVDYVVRLRMQHAAFLLQDINMSVSKVASMVGYEDFYHFSKLFKKSHGVSPRQWRKTNGRREGKAENSTTI